MTTEAIVPLEAPYKRPITYLRLSLTDRCNLRCAYCMPPEGVLKLQHEDILRYEEILKILSLGPQLGFNKLRLTGGEPLVRKGLIPFITELSKRKIFKNISLTTNATLLAPLAYELKASGISGLNISLDALDPTIYGALTGRPGSVGIELFHAAWAGFMAALDAGFSPVKINCVPILGKNESEILPLARLAQKYPVEVRFIERMPIGPGQNFQKIFLPSRVIKNSLEKALGRLTPKSGEDGAPARSFTLKDAPGSLAFISAMSNNFCGSCNRLRLTADGKLKPCLLSSAEIDLKAPLRAGASMDELACLFRQAADLKPQNHGAVGTDNRFMSQIGG